MSQKVNPIECTKIVKESIKNNEVRKTYLLYGEERYLLRQNLHALIEYLNPDNDEMNLSRFEGDKINLDEVSSISDTMPFFKDYRVIVIENSNLFSKDGAKMLEIIKAAPETTVFIFAELNVDTRSALFKEVKDKGLAVEYVTQNEDILLRWIKGRIEKAGKSAQNSVISFFIKRVGDDMFLLSNELEKLLAYCMDAQEITVNDVSAVCKVTLEDRIFDMVDAVSRRDKKTTMMLYHDLLELKEPPVKILSLLQSEYKRMFLIKEHADAGRYGQQIADALNIKEFVVKKRMPIVAKYTLPELSSVLKELVDADLSYKSGNLTDRMALETVLFALTE